MICPARALSVLFVDNEPGGKFRRPDTTYRFTYWFRRFSFFFVRHLPVCIIRSFDEILDLMADVL